MTTLGDIGKFNLVLISAQQKPVLKHHMLPRWYAQFLCFYKPAKNKSSLNFTKERERALPSKVLVSLRDGLVQRRKQSPGTRRKEKLEDLELHLPNLPCFPGASTTSYHKLSGSEQHNLPCNYEGETCSMTLTGLELFWGWIWTTPQDHALKVWSLAVRSMLGGSETLSGGNQLQNIDHWGKSSVLGNSFLFPTSCLISHHC